MERFQIRSLKAINNYFLVVQACCCFLGSVIAAKGRVYGTCMDAWEGSATIRKASPTAGDTGIDASPIPRQARDPGDPGPYARTARDQEEGGEAQAGSTDFVLNNHRLFQTPKVAKSWNSIST